MVMVESDRRSSAGHGGVRVSAEPAVRLAEQPQIGHNRWHPDLPPVLTVRPGEPFTLETIDSSDAYITRSSTASDVASFPMGRVHPLTGPVAVADVIPGDVLEIELLDISPGPFGSVAVAPGEGLLPDLLDAPSLTLWDLAPEGARCPDLPGVTIPPGMFPGTLGVAPSAADVRMAHDREAGHLTSDARTAEHAPSDAVPRMCADGLRTIPPRRNGGNLDVRELVRGARLCLEARVAGGLISVGDLHFAQGAGELAASAIEMAGSVTMRCQVHRSPTWRGCLPAVLGVETAARRSIQTVGVGLAAYGAPAADGLADAARQAAEAMLAWLKAARGINSTQGYVLLSVAADLTISQLVNDPNPTVSAHLPLDVFDPPVDNPFT